MRARCRRVWWGGAGSGGGLEAVGVKGKGVASGRGMKITGLSGSHIRAQVTPLGMRLYFSYHILD